MRSYIIFPEHAKVDGQKTAVRKAWTSEELSALQTYFKSNVQSLVFPGKTMIEDCITSKGCKYIMMDL